MQRRPGDPASQSTRTSHGDGKKPFVPWHAQPSPATITVDETAFELLSRGASEEEARALRRYLTEWCRGDEGTFPFQHAVVFRAQMRAAAAVPVETAKVFEQGIRLIDGAIQRLIHAAEAKISEFEQIGKLAPQLKLYIEQLTRQGEETLKTLYEAASTFRQAHEELKARSRQQDIVFLVVTLLFVAALGGALGFLLCLYLHQGR